MEQDLSERKVKPVIVSKGEKRSLVEKIISHVNSQENPDFLGEESESMSKLLGMISE